MKRTTVALVLILAIVTTSVIFAQARKAEKAKDPVCGLMVDKDPGLSTSYKGETYYFCSKTDLSEFKKNPEKYVKKR